MAEWGVAGYTAVRALGSGGFGEVLLARHDATGTLVAIKYLRAGLLADEGFAAMFRAEAAVLASLDDPHVVRLFEYAEAPAGAAIVMELVDGVSLRQILDRAGGTTPEAALVVLEGSLLGLAAAHRRGVVHRDYKPENVLVSGDGASKLTDFGIAARAGDQPIPAGTLRYAAPEQMAGDPASPASDVYSATATFYECLTGHPPFTGDAVQLMYQHSAEPVPLEPVPEPLRPVVAAGMAKDPGGRPSDAASFVTGLQAVAGRAYGPDWARRGRSHLGEAALLLAALWPSAAAPAAQSAATTYRLSLLRRIRHTSPVKAAIAAGIAAGVIAAGIAIATALTHHPPASKHHHHRAPVARARATLTGHIIYQTPRARGGDACATARCYWDIHQISPYGGASRLLPIGGVLCCGSPALSPDSARLAVTGEGFMGVFGLNGQSANGWRRGPVTSAIGSFLDPAWSPSGRQIAFIYLPGPGQSPEIDVINADGTGRRHVIQGADISPGRAGRGGGALAWSPDGTQIAFATTPAGTGPIPSGTIAVVGVSGGPARTLLSGILGGATALSWAPGPRPLFTDGHQPGIWEANGHGAAKIVLQCGACLDTYPSWAPDGVHFAADRHGKGIIIATVARGVQATIGPSTVTYVQWSGPARALPASAGPSPSAPTSSGPPPAAVVPVVACPTSYGLTQRPPSRYPSTMALPVSAARAGRLGYYSDSVRFVQPVVAPRGWACSAAVGADGSTTLTVFPPGGSASGHEVVPAHDDSACVGCMYDTACPLVPHAGQDLGYSGIPCPAHARPPQETVAWLAGSPAAASAGRDVITFTDPPGVAGDGTGSGGAFSARGLLLFDWGQPGTSPDRASTITCTLPAPDQNLCAAILTTSRRQSWR